MRICFFKTLHINCLFMIKSEKISDLKSWVRGQKMQGRSIGFVPTMGALHEGHLALVKQAGTENDLVVSSIFVNPIQFNKPEDLEKYPRSLESDLEMLELAGCDLAFCPDAHEMYPEPDTTVYDFGMLDNVMEGRHRPGHFNGVAIVVKKLFDLVEPHRAYFGQKDYQQLQVIKALVKMENLDVIIVGCPTVRESDGLAMSSRNQRLTPAQRREAPKIFKALDKARKMYPGNELDNIKTMVIDEINTSPQLEVEYFEISDAETLQPVTRPGKNQKLVACSAVHAGNVRLIDNVLFNS